MPKRSSDVTTKKSDQDVAEAIGAHLADQGFNRSGSKGKNVWKKGVIWTIFASSRVEKGVAHLEVWNHLPYPGMGSFLMYFRNSGRLPDILEDLQKVVAGEVIVREPRKTELRFAGFWRRVAATLIDALLFYVVFGVLFAVLSGVARGSASGSGGGGRSARLVIMNVMVIVVVVAAWIYSALLESSKSQATLGKKALGIKVTDAQGERISFGRATGRFWSKCVSAFAVGIGFLLAAFTGKKQALHDLMARTLVVRR